MADIVTDVLLLFGIPLTFGGVLGLLIQAFVTFLAVVLADKIIAHNIEAKKALILPFASYFLTVLVFLVLAVAGLVIPPIISVYLLPLVIWIALSEVLLSAEMKTKIYVAIVAFVIYIILNDIVHLPYVISRVIPF